MTPQPNGRRDPADHTLTGKRETIGKKTYIRAPRDIRKPRSTKRWRMCKADKGWQIYVNDSTGHDVMIDQPEWLADVLLKAS